MIRDFFQMIGLLFGGVGFAFLEEESQLKHILERALIHFFAGGTVYLLVFFGCRYARRWKYWDLMVPALLALGFIGWREAWDVSHGQTFAKAVTDWISWGLGLIVTIYLLMKWHRITLEDLKETRKLELKKEESE